MKKKKKISQVEAILKAVHRDSRNAEIEAFGHPISYASVVKSKKLYTRKSKHKGSYW